MLPHQYLVAIDPGGTTGLAFRYPNGVIRTHATQTQEGVWQFFLDKPYPDHVILEEWQFFDGIARPAGVLTAGIVESMKGICYVLGISLSLRTPGSRNKFQLEANSWLMKNKPGFVVHEVDALAHLLTWESERSGKSKPYKRRPTK
jgi:hypothetical protein